MKKIKIALVVFLLTNFIFVYEAAAAIQNIVVTVSFDGVSPFDIDSTPGNDASANNGVIRTQDTLEYLVSYEALDTNNTTIVFTAPVGVYWLSNSTASSVCNGTGGGVISGSGNVLTCNRKPPAAGAESFYLRAIPGNIANGTSFTTNITAGAANAISAPLLVSATPKNELKWLFNNFAKTTVNSQIGVTYAANFEFGAFVNSSGNIKGFESVSPAQTVTLDVGPGSYAQNCSICSQPGGPGTPITVSPTINPSFVRFGGSIVGSPGYMGDSTFRGLGLNTILIFTPYSSSYPVGQISYITAQPKNWDPNSLSGVSNWGGRMLEILLPLTYVQHQAYVYGMLSIEQ